MYAGLSSASWNGVLIGAHFLTVMKYFVPSISDTLFWKIFSTQSPSNGLVLYSVYPIRITASSTFLSISRLSFHSSTPNMKGKKNISQKNPIIYIFLSYLSLENRLGVNTIRVVFSHIHFLIFGKNFLIREEEENQ